MGVIWNYLKMLFEKFQFVLKLKFAKVNLVRKRIFVYKNSHVRIDKTCTIDNKGYLHLGFTFPKNRYYESSLVAYKNSKLVVNGDFALYSGYRVSISENAILNLGSGYINYGANIACFNKICIGEKVAISENVTIRDSDNHTIGKGFSQESSPINIGNKVWIGMNVTILKGVNIGYGSVIAAGSVVNKDIPERCLAAGVPAKVIKKNINWE